MSPAIELWKNWEGKVLDGKFPLVKCLGTSDHSAVFLSELKQPKPQKAAIKLIPAENRDFNGQLARWAETTKFSHPHLLRLFEYGSCEIDGTPLFYAVMEYAEENLAEIIPLRPLADSEALAMLQPAAEALAGLHQAGFAHCRIKPSNVMAVGNELKVSSDEVRKIDEQGEVAKLGQYDAPEIAATGFSPASDMWSLGMTLLAVLTQTEPKDKNNGQREVLVPEKISQPLRGIVQQCLQIDPAKRCTSSDILKQLGGGDKVQSAVAVSAVPVEAPTQRVPSKRRMLAPILVIALLLLWWIGHNIREHRQPGSASENNPAASQAGKDPNAALPSPGATRQSGTVRGSVLQQVMPDVSKSALHTVSGRLKVGVEVGVDKAGNVTSVRLVSPGPSQYFAAHAVAAAREWKFNPAHLDGEATNSKWILRFQFARTSVNVSPTETTP